MRMARWSNQHLASEDALARWVLAERKRRGWSQADLAAKVEKLLGGGFPQSAVSKIEKPKGRRAITVDEALALSEVLGIPLIEIVLPPEIAASETLARLFDELEVAKHAASVARDRVEVLEARIREELASSPDIRTEFLRQAAGGDYNDAFAAFLTAQGGAVYTGRETRAEHEGDGSTLLRWDEAENDG